MVKTEAGRNGKERGGQPKPTMCENVIRKSIISYAKKFVGTAQQGKGALHGGGSRCDGGCRKRSSVVTTGRAICWCPESKGVEGTLNCIMGITRLHGACRPRDRIS